MTYEDAQKFLKESLVFRMSLGSKELFHSNVWGWLIENDKEFMKVFIPSFSDTSIIESVKREECDRDLVIS